MARVTITVICDGGSTTKITEQSLFPIHGGPQAAVLVEEAFVRTCRALGLVEQQPAPAPPSPTPEAPPTADPAGVEDTSAPAKTTETAKPATTSRKA